MQAAEGGNSSTNNSYGIVYSSSNVTEDEYENQPLLPQHHLLGATRRRGGSGMPQMTPQDNNLQHNNTVNDDKYDKGNSYYSDAIPCRPTLTSIKSISRIGRYVSPSVANNGDGDFDDAVLTSTANANNNNNKQEDEEYYYDDTNEYSNTCTFGTSEHDGIWLNKNDGPGIVMSIIVWILIIYSGVTITLLAQTKHLSHIIGYFYDTICTLALACHAKTMFSDPGGVPECAVPIDSAARRHETHTMCRACRSYKPPGSHHCRICNRCVSRMDHHCPWMNNCIGAANLKSFILFLIYTWIGSALSLIIFGCNYFFCQDESCEFSGVLVQLVRFMTFICTGSIIFVSSMLANVTFGIMTGSGTIDRLKRKYGDAKYEPDDPPLEFDEVFGTGSIFSCFLPIDPIFPDYDRVLGYSTPQRLLREGNENTSIC